MKEKIPETATLRLEEVFRTNGTPTYTFVVPKRYPEILLSLRTAGRCLVIEGPSGIGKTSAIENAIKEAGLSGDVLRLSGRRPTDIEYIRSISTTKGAGVIVIDDFHKLDAALQNSLADYLKLLADGADDDTKVIIIGINRAGDSLIHFANDLVNRLDIVEFESEPDEKIVALIEKGEDSLGLKIGVKGDVVEAVHGSFYLAQMLCREICLESKVLERTHVPKFLDTSFELVKSSVWTRLDKVYRQRCIDFCRGSKLRKAGRAPYLHVLHWLSECPSWSLNLKEELRKHNELRGSIGQVIDKGFLGEVINSNPDIDSVIHFNEDAETLTIEDPQFLFYISNISWRSFAKEIGFTTISFNRKYDFALSFAGPDRSYAKGIFDALTEHEVEVFYDKNEQQRILAEDVEEYLRPIYASEAEFVVVLLGKDYPMRVWTRLESNVFKDRFQDGKVIPIWFDDVAESAFDESRKVGGHTIKKAADKDDEIRAVVDLLIAKLQDSRNSN
ncbi:MAG: TIR domain-containing protein [Flavobacteriales bacterium]|nr:TIR domain-containing protein [Flavobacteriales bacterium]